MCSISPTSRSKVAALNTEEDSKTGGDNMPAHNPLAGLVCTPIVEPRISTRAWCTTVRLGAADCFNGTNSWELALNAAQQERTGHSMHRGFFGTHTVAPNSINASFSTAADFAERTHFSAVLHNHSCAILSLALSRRSANLENTRATLPSTIGAA